MTDTPRSNIGNHSPATAVVGLQWGDEGKGKAVDLLAKSHDAVVRYNGGANAGHSVVVGGTRHSLHLIPSGILYPGKLAVIGNGVVVDPWKLIDEIDGLARKGIDTSGLVISDRAHAVLPYHKLEDALREAPRGDARLSRAMRESHEALSAFGPARVVQVEAWSNPMEGSLGARLFGAMDAVHGLLGEPETIDAAYVGKSYVTGVHTLPGESLRDLHGDIAATMRFADGRAAVVTASNAAGRWNSCTTLLSEKGRMRIYDDGYEWVGVTGQKQDELRLRRTRGAADQSLLGAAAIAESIGELLDTGKPPPPVNSPVVLAMCQAALLSARTGQPESPATLRGLMGLRM